MTYSVSDIIKDEIKGKATHVTKDVKDFRLKICSDCEHFKRISRQCGICSCFLDVKTIYADSECPDVPPRWKSL